MRYIVFENEFYSNKLHLAGLNEDHLNLTKQQIKIQT